MNIVKKVIIKGFWSDREVDIDFNNDVNFFYGSNGSGKTTILNIIASILSCDYSSLAKLNFESAEIHLCNKNRQGTNVIYVKKERDSDYLSADDNSTVKINYTLDIEGLDEPYKFSLKNSRGIMHYSDKLLNFNEHSRSLISEYIADIVWLTVSRSSYSGDRNADDSLKDKLNPIDQKISFVLTEMARYFSSLDNSSNAEWGKLQTEIFLSLIKSDEDVKIEEKLSSIDFSLENKYIDDVLKKAGVDSKDYSSKTKSFYKKLEPTIKKFTKARAASISEFSLMINAIKLNSIAISWGELQARQKEIYKKKNLFVSIINKLFNGKKIEIIQTNEIRLSSSSGKDLSVYDLSSGEKQLLIILGQALTKQESEWIYIADEPELSLHMDWQEGLVRNIIALSPNVQILFATHSPDIISDFSKSAIDVQKLIKKVPHATGSN